MQTLINQFFDTLFSEKARAILERITLWLSICGFVLHLGLIYSLKFQLINVLRDFPLLENPISAIYTPFTFILIYEIYLLVLYLPRSFTTSLSKQFEIISLILIRRIFGDIPQVSLDVSWFETTENLNLMYDLGGVLILYFLIYQFKKDSLKSVITGDSKKIDRFINSKKGISLILIACLICMSVYSFSHWLIELFSYSSFGNIDSIFYHDFFELLILADVFILLLSFQYTERYTQILRNTGFVICTILIRLSFGTSGLTNVLLIISSVVFGLAILRIYNLSERSS